MKRMVVVAVAVASVLTVAGCSGGSSDTASTSSSAKAKPAATTTAALAADPAGTKKACDDIVAAMDELGAKQDGQLGEIAKGNFDPVQSYYRSFSARLRKDATLTDNATMKSGIESIAKISDGVVNAKTPEEFSAAMTVVAGLAETEAVKKVDAICG
ncbi:hypothetical protein [Nocardia sp. NPDC052566]|uniref:hypothetical protein n=1 Tax=Nocardia sp. NPDC052566 TaxID=3364330 RepID=UPI0037C6A4EA